MSIIYFIKKNYQMVEERSFGYASGYLVSNGNKKGYLNKQGKVVIPAIYDEIEIGSSYFTVTDGGRKGVLDEENELVIPIIFDNIRPIEVPWQGMRNQFFFIVTVDGKNALLDEKNNIVIPLISGEIIFSREWLIITKNKKKGVGSMVNSIMVPVEPDDIAEVWLSFAATAKNWNKVILGKNEIVQSNINNRQAVIKMLGQRLNHQSDYPLMAG